MYSSYKEQREETKIEQILRQIYSKYYVFENETLYYKDRKGELNKVKISKDIRCVNPYEVLERISSLPAYIEGVLYISTTSQMDSGSKPCIKNQFFILSLRPFIDDTISIFPTKIDVQFTSDLKDPMAQLLAYNTAITAEKRYEYAYICEVSIMIPSYDPDVSSPFPGKTVVIANCTTFSNYIRLSASNSILWLSNEMNKLLNDALKKLYQDKEFMRVYRIDPEVACNIIYMKDFVEEELKKANELMRKYGIIHLIFPLD